MVDPRRFAPSGRRWLAGLVLVAVIALLQVTARPALAATVSGEPISAMNGWSLYGLSLPDLNTQLASMEVEGVGVLRFDASWSSIQLAAPGASGSVDHLSSEDAEVAALATHHIRWLPIIDYSAPWAATTVGDWRSPPASDAQFGSFAAAIAARYGPDGTFWAQYPQLPYEPVSTFEIWNEENADYYWDTGPDPAAYGQLYLAARQAIHAVDAGAQVMIGGLTDPQQGISALAFLTQMFQDVPGLAGNVDAVGLHPYAANAAGVVGFVVAVRDLLDSVGESAAPIDVTEFGWQTGSAAVEQQRAANMNAVALALGNSNCGIGMLAPYDWMDPSYISGGDWGLTGSSGIRAAGVSWFAALSSAAASPQTQPCPAIAAPPSTPGATPPPPAATTTTTTVAQPPSATTGTPATGVTSPTPTTHVASTASTATPGRTKTAPKRVASTRRAGPRRRGSAAHRRRRPVRSRANAARTRAKSKRNRR
ncbi:MAG TPA: hypothetical protein VHX62_12880 [Solirubrobacteraceae bacterium]|nr:hypothetical protein [Solirubrobacteraceae bacterium]